MLNCATVRESRSLIQGQVGYLFYWHFTTRHFSPKIPSLQICKKINFQKIRHRNLAESPPLECFIENRILARSIFDKNLFDNNLFRNFFSNFLIAKFLLENESRRNKSLPKFHYYRFFRPS